MSVRPTSARNAAAPSWVALGADSSTPLVAVQTWRNEEKHYARLSDAMAGTPIVSMLAPEVDADRMPRRTEQWVDHFEEVLRSAPVEPPYRFVGWSYGGVVAVELARRLQAAGTDVEFVGMIDSIRPRRMPLDTREYLWYHLGAAAAMTDERARLAYLRKRLLFLLNRRFPKTASATRSVLERVGVRAVPTPRPKPRDPMMVAIHTSYLHYDGDPVPFPVSLYATDASIARAMEPALRWNGWLHGGYEFVRIPGEHFSLWDAEHVGALGAALQTSIARATVPTTA